MAKHYKNRQRRVNIKKTFKLSASLIIIPSRLLKLVLLINMPLTKTAERNQVCKVCKRPDGGFFALCDGCEFWYHPRCLKQTYTIKKHLQKFRSWLCNNCKNNIEISSSSDSENEESGKRKSRAARARKELLANMSPISAARSSQPSVYSQLSAHRQSPFPSPRSVSNETQDFGNQDFGNASFNDSHQHEQDPSDAETETQMNTAQASANDNQENEWFTVDSPGQRSGLISSQDSSVNSSIMDTDEEGYSEVKLIKEWRQDNNDHNKREFFVIFRSNNRGEWIPEENLDGCVTLLTAFCRERRIPLTAVKYKEGCGASHGSVQNKANWVNIGSIIEKANIYGHKNGLPVTAFKPINKDTTDFISILQVGTHAFTILYISKYKYAIVGDGKNLFQTCIKTCAMVMSMLHSAKVVHSITFKGQNEEDKCGASAAAIATEFQKIYRNQEYLDPPKEILVPKTIIQRIQAVLHKEPSAKINERKPITQQTWGIKCEKCGVTLKGKNRSVLNFHKCRTQKVA